MTVAKEGRGEGTTTTLGAPLPTVVLEVVELDSERTRPNARNAGHPALVVAVARSGDMTTGAPAGRADLAGVDIVLVPAPASRPPSASVAVPDVDAELDRLSAIVRTHPMASTVLLHVLRSSSATIEGDLVLESLAYSTLQAGPEHRAWLAGRPAKPPREETGEAVRLDREDNLLTVTLSRPHVRNAYNVAVREGLHDAFELVRLDPSIRAVRVLGEGPSFCSGGDLDEFGTGPGPTAAHLIRVSRSPAPHIAAVADRVTVELHGSCVGAGIELPSFAGRVIAAPDTRIRLPEVEMGLIPGAGGTASIPRRIGRHRATWLALTGEWLDAGTALEWGLVDEIA